MNQHLPLFPLNLVAFPDEEVNLHVFENRYIQLIDDCLNIGTNFGIPAYISNKVEFGTEVEILEITKRYQNGRMDIRTKGKSIFKVLEFFNPWKDKLYSGGEIKYLSNNFEEDESLKNEITKLYKKLFSWLQLKEDIDYSVKPYKIAHKIGLNKEEEYKLLLIQSEKKRQEFILNHLKKIIPALERAEQAKRKIQLNGHFKHLDPLHF